jgi:signal transduction histidine kinase
MLKMLGRLIGENIRLEWVPGINAWPVKIDPTQIDQILANLCVNARDAIKGQGMISIQTCNIRITPGDIASHPDAASGDYVMLSVKDTGCGMDSETRSHVFEPFFTTKGVGEGTGLGLATVYGAVKQNNGFVTVDSEPGKGTLFTIYFPRFNPNPDFHSA